MGRKFFAPVAGVALVGLLLAACGSSKPTASGSSKKTYKVAILMAGSATDGSFDQYTVEGVKAAAAKMGNWTVTVREQLAASGSTAETNAVGDYARMGYDLVIAHG